MNPPKDVIQSVDGSSSKQAGNSFSVLCLTAIARELEKLVDGRMNLQSITFIIKLDRRGRPRAVLTRTEASSELNA